VRGVERRDQHARNQRFEFRNARIAIQRLAHQMPAEPEAAFLLPAGALVHSHRALAKARVHEQPLGDDRTETPP
jgi:hypothetical protein